MNLRTFLAPRAHSAASLARGTLLISLTTTVFSMSALAQDSTKPTGTATKPATQATNSTPAANATFEATIMVDEALVRCEASAEGGYPFGTLAKGQVVTVVETVPGWVRVQTSGPAFEGWGGFITHVPTMQLSADGKSLSLTGTATIVAPNGNEGFLPERSWKAIGYLVPGDTIPVIDTIKGEQKTYYAVPLPARASGWIAASSISRNGTPTTTATAPTTTTTGAGNNAETTAPKSTATGTETGTTGTTTTEGTDSAKKPTETSTEPKTVKKPKAPAEPKAPTAASKTLDEYKALEQKWNSLAKDTCAMADLQELQVSYANLSRNSEALTPTRQAAKLRSIHITQLIELRDMQEHAKKIAARGEDKAREVQAIEEWLRARQQYTAVGVLNASVVYDGERLPRLYRLQDPTSGLTVAYLTEDPDLKLSSMLGLVVGVKGDKKFDESLRRDIITPTSMTVLRSDKETAIASPEKTEGADSGDESGK